MCSQEVIGQVNLRLELLQEITENDRTIYKGKFLEQQVIIANNLVAQMDGEITFEIVDSQKFNKKCEQENMMRRKTILKFRRDHSV